MKKLIHASFILVVAGSLSGSGIGGPVFQLSPFSVEESRIDENELNLGIGFLEAGTPEMTAVSLAGVLEAGLGVTMQKRGSGSLEPNLRGFNLDRVTVSFNGLMLPAASPTRTASPVNFFSPGSISEVLVVTGFPSVTNGPVPVGGRIEIRTDASRPVKDQLNIGISSNPGGGTISAIGNVIQGEQLSLQAGIHFADFDSYDSGSGTKVDEKFKGWGASAAFAYQQDNGNRLDLGLNYFRQDEARNTSLPLDSVDSDAFQISSGYSANIGEGELQLQLGYSESTLQLTSESRIIPDAAPLEGIIANSKARSSSFKIGYKQQVWSGSTMEFGVDNVTQYRDATRTRSLKSGATINDTIWPDVKTVHPGFFLELISDRKRDFEWRVGARLGQSTTEARATDNPVKGIPGSMGTTILENYVAFNGDNASRIKSEDWTTGANVLGQWRLTDKLALILGAGWTVAPPGTGERYRAFLNALGGGVELGNPALDPEIKKSVSIGLAYTSGRLNVSSEIWYADVEDYVTRMTVISSPLIYSFRNHDATFSGMDLQLAWRPFEETLMSDIRFEAAFSLVDGKNKVTGKDVVEIPPWDCSVGLIWERPTNTGDVSVKLEGRYVDSAINPDPGLNPVYKDTASWFSLGGILSLKHENWQIQLRIENALDRLGYSYLQPPVATGPILPAGGDLRPADRVPLPGRSVSLQIGYYY